MGRLAIVKTHVERSDIEGNIINKGEKKYWWLDSSNSTEQQNIIEPNESTYGSEEGTSNDHREGIKASELDKNRIASGAVNEEERINESYSRSGRIIKKPHKLNDFWCGVTKHTM
mgnify:CR=1 FL=1